MSETPSFRMDPTNCVVSIMLYQERGTGPVQAMTFSSLPESLKLSPTLLDDIERKAVVEFVHRLIVEQVVRGVDVTSDSYCEGLAQALGLERVLVRLNFGKEPAEKGKRGAGATDEDMNEAIAKLGSSIELGINIEMRLKELEGRLIEGFRGRSESDFRNWAKALPVEQREEMYRLWERANPR